MLLVSGGLLVALPKGNAEAFVAEMQSLQKWGAWIVGAVVDGSGKASVAADAVVREVPSADAMEGALWL